MKFSPSFLLTEDTLESLGCELHIKCKMFGRTGSSFATISLPWCLQAPRMQPRPCITTATSQSGTWFKIPAHIRK